MGGRGKGTQVERQREKNGRKKAHPIHIIGLGTFGCGRIYDGGSRSLISHANFTGETGHKLVLESPPIRFLE